MHIEDISLAIKIVLLAMVGLIGLFKVIADPNLYARFRKAVIAVLIVGALLSIGTYFRFGNFIHGSYLHYHDVSHYYLGAKYAPELGYFDLYRCIAIAEAEMVGEIPGGRMNSFMRNRDIRMLDTYKFKKLYDIVTDPVEVEACKDGFSEKRWKGFKSDVSDYLEVQNHNILFDRCNDMGYNGTPVWGILSHVLTNLTPVNRDALVVLGMLDPLLMFCGLLLVFFAFGAEAALVLTIIFYSTLFNHRMFIHGSILRFDWMACILMGISFIKLGKYKLSGAFLAYATLVKLFPGILIIGLVVKATYETISTRRIAPRLLRFFGSYGVTALLLVALSIAVFGIDYMREFTEKMDVHSQVVSSTRVGLPYILNHVGDTRSSHFRQADGSTDWKAFANHKSMINTLRQSIKVGLFAIFLLLITISVRKMEDYEAIILGYPLVFLSIGLTVYYCVLISILALLFYVKIRRFSYGFSYLLLVSSMLLAYFMFFQFPRGLTHNFYISLSILILCSISLILFAFVDRDLRIELRVFIRSTIRIIRKLRIALGLIFVSIVFFYLISVFIHGNAENYLQKEITLELQKRGFDAKSELLVLSPLSMREIWSDSGAASPRFMDLPKTDYFFDKKRVCLVSPKDELRKNDISARPITIEFSQDLEFEYESKPVTLSCFVFQDGKESIYGFFENLDKAEVFVQKGDNLHLCAKNKYGKHICKKNDWNFVANDRRIIDNNEHNLIWAHPSDDGIHLVYPEITFGNRIVIRSMLTDFAVDLAEGTPVILEVFADDTKVGQAITPNKRGWVKSVIDTEKYHGLKAKPSLKVTSKRKGRRHFLFEGNVITVSQEPKP